ncbi:Receptor-like protein 12 [Rhynchospora pubera]|uniref:Receptor-like protein 12 n=1 Tax=Rhynchospora pubera TaxID=906938 RepID=A0AAV8HCQ1_9POAL|nr:Receptor-like protein 12 [Rhynchospora pubera]
MTPLLLLLSLTLVLLSFSTTPASLTQAFCIPGQRHALIQLKQGFKTDLLQSWNASTDCCTWDGITCDQLTGMVIKLDLSSRSISGELNPVLFNITSLQYLDLSNNWFHDVKLPDTGFERLTNLTHLDLSCAGFVGDVPISISVLTNLISLDLSNLISSNGADNNLLLDGSRLQIILKNLTKLQVLYLDGVNISSNGSEWGNAVSQVGHTLEELSMMDCSLTGPIDPTLVQLKLLKVLQLDSNNLSSHMPIFLANFSSLRVLSLSACGLRGPFSNEIFHKTDLTVIELSENHMLSGQLPEFTNGSLLQHLFIGGTNFTGPIPNSIGYLQKLSTLELSFCDFYGEVPTSVVNLTKLIDVYFQRNRFTGMIPISLFSHPSLESLDLSENKFTGYLLVRLDRCGKKGRREEVGRSIGKCVTL